MTAKQKTKRTQSCRWLQEDFESEAWATSCGNFYGSYDGTPRENGMGFCCYCGKPIKEILAKG